MAYTEEQKRIKTQFSSKNFRVKMVAVLECTHSN